MAVTLSRLYQPASECPFVTNVVGGVGFTIGVEATNVINVALQLRGQDLGDLNVRGGIRMYLSDDANGDSLAATAPSSGVAIGTDGLLITQVTNKAWTVTSESDGDIDINITEASVATWYLVVVLPDGSLVVSGAITFA